MNYLMKNRRFVIGLLLGACVAIAGAYLVVSLRRTNHYRMVTLQADLVFNLAAAEALREGRTQEALVSIENHAYGKAYQLFGAPGPKTRMLDSIASHLREYRRINASDTSKWSVIEVRLDQILAAQKRTK